MSEAERDAFIAAFSEEHGETQVGFAVLGGIFGEGIDLVGERLIGAVIVGVGLPQLCVERDLIRAYFQRQGKTNTPAHLLVRLGYAAVPQLIAALDLDTITRSVGYWRNFTFSHHVLTVGDCCEAILRRITGTSFFVPTTTSSYMTKDGKASAEAWWNEFQKKGEKQMLLDAVVAGGKNVPAQGEILSQKYPEDATKALVQGARSTTDSCIRSRLIDQIAKLNRATGRDFLTAELKQGPTLHSRGAAAFGLLPNQKQLATDAMIQEWKNLPTIRNGDKRGWETLVDFLGSCDSVDAVNALSENLRPRSPAVKLEVVTVLGEKEHWSFNRTLEPASTETLVAMEASLIAALDDTEERMGLSGARNGKNYSDPRILESASEKKAASCLWPRKNEAAASKRTGASIMGVLLSTSREKRLCLYLGLNRVRKRLDSAAVSGATLPCRASGGKVTDGSTTQLTKSGETEAPWPLLMQ